MRRRVVITGVGPVAAAGVGAASFWEALRDARTGITPIESFDASGFASRLGASVSGVNVRDFVPKSYRKATKVMARDVELAVIAAYLACEDAGLTTRAASEDGAANGTTYPPERVGCQIGAGLIAAETEELTRALVTAVVPDGPEVSAGFSLRAWGTGAGKESTEAAAGGASGGGGMNNLPPLWMLKYLPNMLACHVTIIHGCEGPSNTITCGEASGLLSLGESARVIERGDADCCFAGSCESKLSFMGMLRIQFAGRLGACEPDESAGEVMRPFDPQSRGSILGEGGGIFVLEEREGALARGAAIHAEIVGFGAAHAPGPFPSANLAPPLDAAAIERTGIGPDLGLVDAIHRALGDAHLEPGDIDAIVPRAAGVPLMDHAERMALAEVFGPRLASVPIVPWMHVAGDCCAGSGGVQAAVAAQMLRYQAIPARPGTPGAKVGGLDLSGPARDTPLKHVLACSTAMGGQSAALVLRRGA
ncbi:MAG: beta-ketoacyl synthase N-terminal-like domain-containing protein [Phycisphaerales bacterium]|jgi:3-oxoacyl-[acyl-carrier-protein] synthase II|nr:beta-ketoacyl synthase N-terminal-like domain-containing protein [Phycisphaerales bacterium]